MHGKNKGVLLGGGRLFVGGLEFCGVVKEGGHFFHWAKGGTRIFCRLKKGDQNFSQNFFWRLQRNPSSDTSFKKISRLRRNLSP